MIELKEYISETLIQIQEGVAIAESRVKKKPGNKADSGSSTHAIEFDLPVIVEEKKTPKGRVRKKADGTSVIGGIYVAAGSVDIGNLVLLGGASTGGGHFVPLSSISLGNFVSSGGVTVGGFVPSNSITFGNGFVSRMKFSVPISF